MATICGDCGGEMGDPHVCAGLRGRSGIAAAQAEINDLRAELARERARAVSIAMGCCCVVVEHDLPPSHVAGCLAMEGSKLRNEMEHWRNRAHAMLAAARAKQAAAAETQIVFASGARMVFDAVERAYAAVGRAYAEPLKEPT